MILSWGLLGHMSSTSGIAAAKSYLDVHPKSQIAILEKTMVLDVSGMLVRLSQTVKYNV